MRGDRIRLSRRHQAWLYATFGALFGSGLLWLFFRYWVRVRGEFGETAHPLEPWFMKAHGAAAMFALILIGSLLPGHIRRGWKAGKNRVTGAAFVVVNALLIVSGYALYYFAGEVSRAVISAAHWVLGLLFPIVLVWHVWRGRRLRKSTPALPSPSASQARTSNRLRTNPVSAAERARQAEP